MLDWLFKQVVIKFVGIFTDFGNNGWDTVLDWIAEAEVAFKDGATRGAWVKEQITTVFKLSFPFVAGLILECVVAWASKQGIINTGD